MELTVKDILEHSFVITIDKERHSLFKRIFKSHGIGKPCPKKFQGVTIWYNSPQYNCSLSHVAAIEKAKKLDWPYVCIFEDDAYPVTGIKDELEKYLSDIPDDCAVLVLGSIFCHGSLGLQGDFLKGIRIYEGHSFILFRNYYDKYLELLKKFPEGDGPLYKTDNDIIPLGQFYGTGRNLFIQYSPENGMNNKSGYILYYSMANRNWIKFPDEYIFHKGFPKVEELLAKEQKKDRD